jgi:hypothetical protein
MQNSALSLSVLALIKQIFMVIGFILFVLFSGWSLTQMNDQQAVRGTDHPKPSIQAISLLPQ